MIFHIVVEAVQSEMLTQAQLGSLPNMGLEIMHCWPPFLKTVLWLEGSGP